MNFLYYTALQVSESAELSFPERTLACPGEAQQYSCNSSSLINWNIFCPGQLMTRSPQRSVSVDTAARRHESSFMCSIRDWEDAMTINIVVTYKPLGYNMGISNISATATFNVLSVTGIESLTLECNDDSENLRYIDLIGSLATCHV